jgi:two-component system nitrate/nitrite sensor histidine kinase NarX
MGSPSLVRLARKTQSLDLLYDVALSLNQPGPLEQVLERFLATLAELVDARAARVELVDAEAGPRIAATHGEVPAAPDMSKHAVVPIQYQERALGSLDLHFEHAVGAMGEDLPELLATIGRHLGLAIEKARLEGEARKLAILEERNLIGNELHDSLAQSLIGMRLKLVMLAEALTRGDVAIAQYEARSLQRAVGQAHDDLRELLTNFRLKIGDSGLVPSVQNLVERFRRETGIAAFFQNECGPLALTTAQETQVYFIIQEALSNIRRHSEAMNVRVMIANEADLYTVLIEDDGRGMPEAPEDLPSVHAGLAIMRQRAERLPGQIVIESDPGEGMRIVLIFNAPTLAAAPAVRS